MGTQGTLQLHERIPARLADPGECEVPRFERQHVHGVSYFLSMLGESAHHQDPELRSGSTAPDESGTVSGGANSFHVDALSSRGILQLLGYPNDHAGQPLALGVGEKGNGTAFGQALTL
jgi:hypothetical protein